jgi:hypothetical protein
MPAIRVSPVNMIEISLNCSKRGHRCGDEVLMTILRAFPAGPTATVTKE